MVNRDFVLKDDNYDVALGGNVRIMVGPNNPFYGKAHTVETIKKIKKSREVSNLTTYQCVITDNNSGQVFRGYSEALTHYGFVDSNSNNANKKRVFLGQLVCEGVITISNEKFRDVVVRMYEEYQSKSSSEHKNDIKQLQVEMCTKRFTGKPQTPEQVEKRVQATKRWREENPELHREQMEKINKNPEKIRKTAEFHRGRKRSQETRNKISAAKQGQTPTTKGKTPIRNISTGVMQIS